MSKRKCCKRECVSTRRALALAIMQLKDLTKDKIQNNLGDRVIKMRQKRRKLIGWSKDKYDIQADSIIVTRSSSDSK